MKLKDVCLLLGRKAMIKLDSIFKSRDITLPTKVHLVKAMVFPVVMYGCESWTVKKAEHQRTDAFELLCWKRLESPLDCKEIQPVHSKGDQPCVFFGRNDAKAETPVLWPPHEKSWLIGKVCNAGRDWGQEEMRTTEDEMTGWNHWLDGRNFEWTPGIGDGQGDLACCGSWGHKESDMTERLNWTELIQVWPKSNPVEIKGLDLVDRVPEKLWVEVHDIVQEAGIKTIPKKKKSRKAKW